MIHSSRQIKNRADAYGGYGTESERLVETAPSARIVSDNPAAPIGNESIVLKDAAREQQRQVDTSMYSTRETLGESVAQQPRASELPPRPAREKKSRTSEDLMPTIKTLKYNDENQAAEETTLAKRKSGAIDPKNKVMLTIYVTIALVLAIAVIVTGVYISGAQAEAAAVTGALSQKQAIIFEQETTLAELLDEDNILEQATANGMVKPDGTDYVVDRVDKVDVPETPPLTNGFDKFCDGFGQFLM